MKFAETFYFAIMQAGNMTREFSKKVLPIAYILVVLLCITLFSSSCRNFIGQRRLEAESGIVSGTSIRFSNDVPGYSGTGSLFLQNPQESITVTMDIFRDDRYQVFLRYRIPENSGAKTQIVSVDGNVGESFTFPESDDYTEIPIGVYHLTRGNHKITLTSHWGWMYVDCFRVEPFSASEFLPGKAKLSNSKSSPAAKRVYHWICENFGKKILSGQQESLWRDSPDYEVELLKKWTGKYPAIRGLDYMNNDFDGVNRRAIAWWKRGGLVTICWHTGMYGGGYDESKDFVPDFERLLTEGTYEHESMIANWDRAAAALSELRDAGVVVLWRPFHEFDGRWFWWGKGTPEQFVRLWRMMYRRYTEKFHLDNLIWVLGFSDSTNPNWYWYVGDEFCDVIGSDTYNNTNHAAGWNRLLTLHTKNKPFAFHECGILPPLSDFRRDCCLWSWFTIWHTDWLLENDPDHLKEFYNQPEVITLDSVPNFSEN